MPAPLALKVEQDQKTVRLAWRKTNTHRDTRNHAVSGEFRVRSVDTSTLGDPSAPTTWVKTPPAPPSEAVESLKWKALDNVTILVEWDPVETAHKSGDHLRYRLSWSLDKEVEQDNSSKERKFLAHHIDTKTPQAIVRLNATEDCRMLVFSVSASGKASRPQKISCYSLYGEDSVDVQPRPPMPAPLALKVEQDQKTVRLAWRKTNTHRDTRNHAVSGENEVSGGYLVELRTKEDRQWRPAPREVVAESEPQSVTLSDLVPNTLYQFRVRSLDTSTLGDPSAPTTWVKTPPAPPSEAVESLKWKALDNVTILVEWDPVETAHKSGDHLRYRLSWSLDKEVEQDNSSKERKFLAHHMDTKTPQAIIRLNATEDCRMLVFSVRPVNDQGVGATMAQPLIMVGKPKQDIQFILTNIIIADSSFCKGSCRSDDANQPSIKSGSTQCTVAGYNSGGTGPLSAPRTIRLGPQSSIDDSSSTTADLRLGALVLISLLLL
ncbi:fibronectin type III domain protein [Teladorsagia circumcincta]|uniref:Fibronectin type III domain protein n=1 Tax=Teladorsagia circumcincta TaxID=45464 RepID=A0A2G9UF78_TELCI|nr:fibronectin type III domain protein [Teladorsagia circumcincta]